jgi:cytochrome c
MSKSRAVKFAIACGASLALLSGAAFAEGNIAAGEIVFQRCFACHGMVDPTHVARMGPTLHGIVGRPVASVAGYAYSDAMKAFGATGAHWDEATLDQFLRDPMGFVKGMKMVAPPVRRNTERADLIAYLKSQ